MKKTLLFLAIFVTLGCRAQSYLTYGQVFNFDVGDVMQMQATSNSRKLR